MKQNIVKTKMNKEKKKEWNKTNKHKKWNRGS